MKILTLALMGASLVGCGNPVKYFDEELARLGYIRYVTPMKEAGTGTIVGGTPQKLAFMVPATRCFPNEVDGIPTNLRYIDDTTVPRRQENFRIGVDFYTKIFEVLSAGAPAIRMGVNINHAHSMDLEMNGVHVEYMDSTRVAEFYNSGLMSDSCKNHLDSFGFIVQALKVDNLKFRFFREDGGAFQLDVENIEQFLDIGIDTRWHLEGETTIVIETPKYVAYQLGALRHQDNGMALYRASKVKGRKFFFESIYVFDQLDRDEERRRRNEAEGDDWMTPAMERLKIDLGTE